MSTTSQNKELLLIIGGTGAQGLAVIKSLTADGRYHVRVLTRDTKQKRSAELAKNPHVELIEGRLTDEKSLHRAFDGVSRAFVNIDGFTVGEKTEIFWGMRIFEIAKQHHVKHYVFSNLDYGFKKGGYDEKYRCGHYDGKGRVAEWIAAQPLDGMTWSILTSGPYMDMLTEFLAPHQEEDGTFVFSGPIGDGAIPLIALEDLGVYARWIFDNIKESGGFNLEIASEHVSWPYLAKTFTEVTGKPARADLITEEEYFGKFKPDALAAHEDPQGMTFKQNFSGWWAMWRNNIIKRDYDRLNKIHPNRLNLKSWMIKSKYDGTKSTLLKLREDGHRSALKTSK